jgi:NADP-dependent 3-hydroxy acid dehydrogenase YdfG
MRLVLADIESEALQAAHDALTAEGAAVVSRTTDVSQRADVDALRDLAVDAFGSVHLVVNNAGVSVSGPAWEFSDAVWKWVLDVNLWGVIHGVSAFMPLLVAQGDGHVVNTASMQGLAPTATAGPYAVSKTGVVALSEVLRADLDAAGVNVGVSVLCPGPVRTRIYASDRNRPAGVEPKNVNSTERVKAYLDANGIAAETVAEQVLDAVRTNRFYVLTDRTRIDDVARRAAEIMQGDDE